MTFDEVFARALGHEKGYVNDPHDPGGETKYGISKRSYPGEDIKNLTVARAKELYLRDFWGPAGCDAVPDEVKFGLFDFAINSGVVTAVKRIQEIVGTTADGVLGPHTLLAISTYGGKRLAMHLEAERLIFMTHLHNWPRHGKGWARRISANLRKL